MVCSVNDHECSPGRLRRGLCFRHYRRLLRTGNTESARMTSADNLSRYIEVANGCWRWTGAVFKKDGYGKLSIYVHGTRIAHRAMYIEHVGLIPTGLVLDHVCHNSDPTCVGGTQCLHRRCVNPSHLEPTTPQVNQNRGKRWAGRIHPIFWLVPDENGEITTWQPRIRMGPHGGMVKIPTEVPHHGGRA